MSEIKNFVYDVEQLYIEGYSAKSIAVMLEVPYELVLDTLDSWSVADSEDDLSPYETINS
jgi:hypothetical protein